MRMRVVACPPLLVLLLCGEYLLPHEPPHPGAHFLRPWRQPEVHSLILLEPAEAFFGDLQDLLVDVAEVLPSHRARRHPRGNALSAPRRNRGTRGRPRSNSPPETGATSLPCRSTPC